MKNLPYRIQRLKAIWSDLVSEKEVYEESGHHYSDVMIDDMAKAIDALSRNIEALEEIQKGEL